MKWEICYLPDSGIVHVRSFGVMDVELIDKMSREVLSVLFELDVYRSLIDLSKSNLRLSMAEILELPARLEALGMRRTSKVALLCPADPMDAKSVRIFGLLAVKSGFMTQVFEDEGEAFAWLSGISNRQKRIKSAANHYSQCFDAMLSSAKPIKKC